MNGKKNKKSRLLMNRFNPLVSAVIITYNSAKYVIETLDSIKAQTYQNIELIVSDDCSTDETTTLVKEWLEKNGNRFESRSGNVFEKGIREGIIVAVKRTLRHGTVKPETDRVEGSVADARENPPPGRRGIFPVIAECRDSEHGRTYLTRKVSPARPVMSAIFSFAPEGSSAFLSQFSKRAVSQSVSSDFSLNCGSSS